MLLNGIDKMIKDPLLDKETRHREAIIYTNCSIIERKASMFFCGQLEGDEKKRLLSEIITLAKEAIELLEEDKLLSKSTSKEVDDLIDKLTKKVDYGYDSKGDLVIFRAKRQS